MLRGSGTAGGGLVFERAMDTTLLANILFPCFGEGGRQGKTQTYILCGRKKRRSIRCALDEQRRFRNNAVLFELLVFRVQLNETQWPAQVEAIRKVAFRIAKEIPEYHDTLKHTPLQDVAERLPTVWRS